MKYGFLYPVYNFAFNKLKYLTLVEAFKEIGCLTTRDQNKKEQYGRWAVDIFLVLKWIYLILIWKYRESNCFNLAFVWYLLITNIYTYFYYHLWDDKSFNLDGFTKDRLRRRFANILLAISYSDVCFAYLYSVPYHLEFGLKEGSASHTQFLWYSISNSIAANYDAVKSLSPREDSLAMIQLIITFIFIATLLSKSIPQTSDKVNGL